MRFKDFLAEAIASLVAKGVGNHLEHKRGRGGFTLAETLITLTIIGLVAALGIPTLITKVRDIKRRAQVQVTTSIIMNAADMAKAENGDTLQGLPADFLIKYLRVLKTTSGSDNSLGLTQVTLSDGTKYPEVWGDAKYALVNGTILMPRMLFPSCDYKQQNLENICGDLIVDMDGAKGRQVVGEDVYYFWITSTGIVPNRNDEDSDKYPIYGQYANTCKKGGTGWSCSGHLITGGDLP